MKERHAIVVTDRANTVQVYGAYHSRERAQAHADLLSKHLPDLDMDDPEGNGGLSALTVDIVPLRHWQGFRAILEWFGLR